MSGRIETYRDLVAWQRAFEPGLSVNRLIGGFPDRERFGLGAQPRRNAVSVPSNISEGHGRGSTADYLRFLKIARGALYEMDTQLLFARELAYVATDRSDDQQSRWTECEQVLAGLIRAVDASEGTRSRLNDA